MAAIYVKVNGRYVAIPTLKGDTSDVSNDIISDAQSIVLPPSVKAIKDYVDDELDDALVSAINSGDLVIAFNKYSDLPETGHYAYVRTNETTSQTGSVELVEGNQYTLYLNPAPNYDVDIYGFDITGAAGFDDNKYSVSSGTAPYRILITAHKGTETHIWQYGEYGYYSELGWWYLVNEFGSTKSAVKIDYSELPVLSGTVSHGGGATYLGFPFASETPYSTKNYGLYRYDENLEQWVWTDSGYFENREVLGLFATTNGELTFDGEEIGYKFPNAEVLAKFTEENDQLYFDGLPISGVNVEKFSDLPENGTIALVQNDEVITQSQSDFDADTEYSLFVNPQIPLDVDFEVTLIQSESEFDNGTITLTLNTTELSHPVFVVEARITDGQIATIKQWFYAENEIIVNDLTILKGWSSVDRVSGVITKNESISYTDLPNLDGTFVEANSLGGTYFSETPYGVNKFGLYNYDTDLEKWVRVDGDSSLWCESTGFLAKAFGYGNTVGGQLGAIGGGSGNTVGGGGGAIGGGSGNTVGGQLGAIGGGYGNTVGGQLGAIGGGYGNTVGGGGAFVGAGYSNTANGDNSAIVGGIDNIITCGGIRAFIGAGHGLTASQQDSTIVGRYGETPVGSLFSVANGSSSQQSTAFDVYNDRIISSVPFIAPMWIELYGSVVNQLQTDIINYVVASNDIELVLPNAPTVGAGKFEMWVNTNGTSGITFNQEVTWDTGTPFNFMRPGIHRIIGYYIGGWILTGSQADVSGYLAGEYPAEPNENDFLNADGTFKEVASIPTMTEYDTVLTLNNANYWTTTASVEFALPTAVSGKKNTFTLFVKVTEAGHAVTFSPSGSQRLGAVAHTFGVGTHLVEGVYNPIDSKWLLGCSAVGVPV